MSIMIKIRDIPLILLIAFIGIGMISLAFVPANSGNHCQNNTGNCEHGGACDSGNCNDTNCGGGNCDHDGGCSNCSHCLGNCTKDGCKGP